MIDIEVKIKPLSINDAFRGRHFKTADCKAYERELWLLLPKQEMVRGEVEVFFEFGLRNYSLTDASNLVKVTEDILVKKGYFEDDRKVRIMHLTKKKSEENYIKIRVEKL